MQSQAIAIQPEADSVANLDFYRMRDDFVRAYKPVTEEEKLLVTQMMRAWQHLNDVYELRSRLTAQKGLLGLFEEDFEKYKFLMRNLTEAERMWRHALVEFQRTRRRRDNLGSPRRANITTIPSMRPMPEPPAADAATGTQPTYIAANASNQNTPDVRHTVKWAQPPACEEQNPACDPGEPSRNVTTTRSRPGSA